MYDYFSIALRSIMSSKLRSGLTLLGVVIGVWAITSMQAVVSGFDGAMEDELAVLGSETFVIQKFPAIVVGHSWHKYHRRKNFTYEDALYLRDNAKNLSAVAAVAETYGKTVKFQDHKTAPSVKVTGTMADYQVGLSLEMAEGHFITDDDVQHNRSIVVIGRDVAAELFPFQSPVGNTVYIGSHGYQVVGVLDQIASSFGQSADNVAFVPITVYLRHFMSAQRRHASTSLVLKASSTELVDQAMDEAIALMRVRRKVPLGEENDFEILSAESIMNTMMDFTQYIRLAAVGIAGISLLVAGIGIMNIMLVSVMERTKEIGTRKAVGAKRRNILMQFLIEAVLLSEFGALIGIIVGVITALSISPMLNMEARVPLWAILAALGYCSVIGIFFGLYPANKASKMDPIEALRYE
ncbi:ABC transporter permease [Candidatus Neomarinimicrobiota bacterium]